MLPEKGGSIEVPHDEEDITMKKPSVKACPVGLGVLARLETVGTLVELVLGKGLYALEQSAQRRVDGDGEGHLARGEVADQLGDEPHLPKVDQPVGRDRRVALLHPKQVLREQGWSPALRTQCTPRQHTVRNRSEREREKEALPR